MKGWSLVVSVLLSVCSCSKDPQGTPGTADSGDDMATDSGGQSDGSTDDVRGADAGSDSGTRDTGTDVGGDGGADAADAAPAVAMEPCLITSDSDNDGTIDRSIRQEFDEQGNIVRREQDDGADGTVEVVQTWVRTTNEVTRLDDNDNDGTPEFSVRSVYDDQGRLLREESDFGADGTVNESTEYEYVADGEILRTDSDGDGTFDSSHRTFRDAEGRVVRTESDSGIDGVDEVRTWAYDAAGNQVRAQTDLGNDGVLDDIRTWTYDAQNRVTRQTIADGTGVVWRATDYVWSADGLTETANTDVGDDGTIDEVFIRTYDAAGHLVYHFGDRDNDGVPQWVRYWEYDEYGRLVRSTSDIGGDGAINSVEVRVYECL